MGDLSRAGLVTFGKYARTMADSTPDTRVRMAVSGARTVETKVGSMSDTDRELWDRLAREIERYTSDSGAPTDDDVPLVMLT